MKRLLKFLVFTLFLGMFSSVQAMELEQPEYVGAVFSYSGKGPITFEQWRTENCSLKDRNNIVIGAGEGEITFKITQNNINKYTPTVIDWYLDKGKTLICKDKSAYGQYFYTKTKEGERLIIVHLPPVSDGSGTFEFYLIRPDGGVRQIKLPYMDMLCESLKTPAHPYVLLSFQAKQMKCIGDSIIVPGQVGYSNNAQKIKLIMQWNDNAQWFDAEIVNDQ